MTPTSRAVQPGDQLSRLLVLMQVGMIIGFFTSWPANVWLVRRGIKVPM